MVHRADCNGTYACSCRARGNDAPSSLEEARSRAKRGQLEADATLKRLLPGDEARERAWLDTREAYIAAAAAAAMCEPLVRLTLRLDRADTLAAKARRLTAPAAGLLGQLALDVAAPSAPAAGTTLPVDYLLILGGLAIMIYGRALRPLGVGLAVAGAYRLARGR